jgi:DNA-binding protein WhiA
MSFSSHVKAELCRVRAGRDCCDRAELCGVFLYCNQFSPGGIKIVTESAEFAARLPQLFRRTFGLSFDQVLRPPGGKHIFLVEDGAKLRAVWESCGCDLGGIAHHINFAFLEEEHCRRAFLRGVFLSGGSVTDPQKAYHLELVCSHLYVSRELAALLLDMGFSPKETTRGANRITYFKQSEHIEDFLTALGAPLCAMEIMNAKAEKNLRNGVNRRVNCDAANADKTVDAAQEQLAAIRALEGSGRLDALSGKLREAADLRVQNPSSPLTELAALCDPPVTKSCLNHRLRKLIALSMGN